MKAVFILNNRTEDTNLRLSIDNCPFIQVTVDEGRYVLFEGDCKFGEVLTEDEFDRKILDVFHELLKREKGKRKNENTRY